MCPNNEAIEELVGSYQLEGDDACCFGSLLYFNLHFKPFIGLKQKSSL